MLRLAQRVLVLLLDWSGFVRHWSGPPRLRGWRSKDDLDRCGSHLNKGESQSRYQTIPRREIDLVALDRSLFGLLGPE
ncbi:hypothetical protein BKA59DRAFT_472453 [Fusarium tricinctum]|uniref:Secreted protein n=1 Tax=Fusarium tricinctum TaxID=61284 RepID=A0A8K0WEI4_9HYPO|nr:hypothetical protein BKA59DRAFT_472453 [Fusarium tricinctum]